MAIKNNNINLKGNANFFGLPFLFRSNLRLVRPTFNCFLKISQIFTVFGPRGAIGVMFSFVGQLGQLEGVSYGC